ncbi:MAG: hypothetical protein S4CHLAM123_08400 [Chlamydiales bacterium]|nr:hypothetical protein [Chlamydiales bacterium]
MKKDIQRFGLALVIGSLAIITGCEQRNNKQHENMNKNKSQYHPSNKNGNMMDSHSNNGSSHSGGNGSYSNNACG